jgi:NADPH-dependent ferric siderophore reductase
MYSIESDREKRLIVITVAGRVTSQEVQAAAIKVRDLVKDFEPGFSMLADFRLLAAMDSSAAPYIAEIMDTVAKKQIARVVRVIPDPRKDIGLNILSRFHYGPEIEIVTVETLADAFEILATTPT